MRKTDVETGVEYYRNADRVTQQDRLWYFASREGVRGPFLSSQMAQFQLKRYVDIMEFVNDNESALPDDFSWEDVTFIDIEKPLF
jgi:hypothetical protein